MLTVHIVNDYWQSRKFHWKIELELPMAS